MKWLCEVRLGPIYSETQGSPHSVDDESFSNKVSRNSSSSLKSYHLHCNQYLCSISTSTGKYSRELSSAHDLHHQSHHVSNQPSWVGGWAVWPVTLLSLDLHTPPFHLGLLWSFLTAKSIGVMALSWQYYIWPVWVWVSVFCLHINFFVFKVKTWRYVEFGL